MSPIHVAFLVFPDVTQLDLTGPAQVLSRLGNTKTDLVWKTRDPVPTDAGFDLLPTATFDEIRHADILCVPGGFGTTAVMEDPIALEWVQRIAEGATWVTSVCTGSLILAATGMLKGRRAACHWASRHQLAWFGAEPVADRVVFDGNIVTGGGVTAGIDFALALAAQIRGEDHAKLIQLSIEYDPAPPFDCGSPEKASVKTLARYAMLVEERASGREARVRAIADAAQSGR